MITQKIYIRDLGWSIRCYFDTTSEDAEEILNELWYLGCDTATYRKAERNLFSGKDDTGLCYSNYARKDKTIKPNTIINNGRKKDAITGKCPQRAEAG